MVTWVETGGMILGWILAWFIVARPVLKLASGLLALASILEEVRKDFRRSR